MNARYMAGNCRVFKNGLGCVTPHERVKKGYFCQAYGYKNLGETLSSWSVQQQVSRRFKKYQTVAGRNRPFGISYFR